MTHEERKDLWDKQPQPTEAELNELVQTLQKFIPIKVAHLAEEVVEHKRDKVSNKQIAKMLVLRASTWLCYAN